MSQNPPLPPEAQASLASTRQLRHLTPDDLGRLEALSTISAMLNTAVDTEDVLRRVIDLVIASLDADRGFVMLDRGASEPEIMVARGLLPETYCLDEFRFSRTVVQRVLSSREPVVCINAVTDARFADSSSIKIQGTRSILCVPLRAGHRMLGVIYLDNLTADGIFTTESLQLVQVIADLAAAAIYRAQHVSQLVQTEKLAALGTLLAGIAHELNNPLATILGFTELLDKAASDAQQKDMVGCIDSEAKRCRQLIHELLTLARREPPTRKPVAIPELIERTVLLLKPDFYRDGVDLRVHTAPSLPPVLANADQLMQVLINLLNNARLAVRGQSEGRVTVRALALHERLTLDVSDNGPGIRPAYMRQIFDPFFTTRPAGEGTGLGLSIVQRIVNEHGGTVQAFNNATGGALFVVQLPAAE